MYGKLTKERILNNDSEIYERMLALPNHDKKADDFWKDAAGFSFL